MSIQLQTARVLFSQIDLSDSRFRLTPGPVPQPSDALKESISRTGVLHPPILKKNNDVHLVVSGHALLPAAREVLGQASCGCLLLPEGTTDIEALSTAMEAIRIKRTPSVMEQAIFLLKLREHLDDETLAERFLPLLGLPPSPYHLQRALALTRLEEPLALALHNGFLNEAVAREMIPLPFTDRLALFEVMEFLHLSLGNQKKLALTCKELAKRHNCSIIDLLAAPEIREILAHAGANPPQKAANLMVFLTDKRFPRLRQAEKAFQKFRTGLKLPKGVTLSHTPAFENEELVLSLPFRDKEKLLKIWPLLRELLVDKTAP